MFPRHQRMSTYSGKSPECADRLNRTLPRRLHVPTNRGGPRRTRAAPKPYQWSDAGGAGGADQHIATFSISSSSRLRCLSPRSTRTYRVSARFHATPMAVRLRFFEPTRGRSTWISSANPFAFCHVFESRLRRMRSKERPASLAREIRTGVRVRGAEGRARQIDSPAERFCDSVAACRRRAILMICRPSNCGSWCSICWPRCRR